MHAATAPRAPTDRDRPWSPSTIEALPASIPLLDPVEQMMREQHRESALLRLVLCAALSVLLLGAAGTLLS